MGLVKWWKQMKETYGDLPPKEAFAKGKLDGQILQMNAREERKKRRKK